MGRYVQNCLRSVEAVWGLNRTGRLLRTARYLLRFLCNPVGASRWLYALNDRPELRFWLAHNPRFLLKPSRPYLSRDYSYSQRLRLVSCHHALLTELLAQHNIALLATGHAFVLASITGKLGETYSITLRKTDKFDREGELILGLQDVSHCCEVFRLVISLSRNEGGSRCLEIGCVQGPRRDAGARELVRGATKAFFGARPKCMLVEASYSLANAWGISEILGVSNDYRIYKSPCTFADYDALWTEMGGVADRNGMFRLPPVLNHRNFADVPSHHRSEYRKRATLRHDVAGQIEAVAKTLCQQRIDRPQAFPERPPIAWTGAAAARCHGEAPASPGANHD